MFSGHEHVMQYKYNTAHVVSGAVMYFLGLDNTVDMTWRDNQYTVGFTHTTVSKDYTRIRFISNRITKSTNII